MGIRKALRRWGMRVASCAAVLLAVSGGFAGTAMASGQTGWVESGGELYWYDNGVMARDKQVYDPASDAWYWFDADGTMARDKDVFIPVSNEDRSRGKWVRYDSEGHMVKGEDYRYGGWYYFDPVTGEMAKGFVYVSSNGGKWVFYDYITGQMAHGERYIDGSHGDEPGWMCFDENTGAVIYRWKYLDEGSKWVFYDAVTGRMAHGWKTVDGTARYFDIYTGAYVFDGHDNTSDARQLLDLVNRARAAVGVAPLVWDEDLAATARLRAAELSITFGHMRPDWSECFTAFPKYFQKGLCAGGENISRDKPNPQSVNAHWTASPGHYANMVSDMFDRFAAGCFVGNDGGNYWVEVFTSDPLRFP